MCLFSWQSSANGNWKNDIRTAFHCWNESRHHHLPRLLKAGIQNANGIFSAIWYAERMPFSQSRRKWIDLKDTNLLSSCWNADFELMPWKLKTCHKFFLLLLMPKPVVTFLSCMILSYPAALTWQKVLKSVRTDSTFTQTSARFNSFSGIQFHSWIV